MTPAIAPIDFKNFSFQPMDVSDLPGFREDSLENACLAWHRSAAMLKILSPETSLGVAGTRAEWQTVLTTSVEASTFRPFLEAHFKAYRLSYEGSTQGLFTGYFEPCLRASRKPTSEFSYPVYGRPPELIVIEDLAEFNPALAGYRIAGTPQGKTLKPYYTRSEVSSGILEGRALEVAWVSNELDLYFMHIQGSGKLDFEEGWTRLEYDGTNGYPYTSIGKYMLSQGYITPDQATMEGLKQWFKTHPEKMRAILTQNRSFVFFKDLGPQEGPIGRQGAVLTPERSLAVDPRVISLGVPLWLSAEALAPSGKALQRFMVAQDVGGAIKGAIRGDFYWGTGASAGAHAGNMKASGELYFLIPKTVKFKGFDG